MRLYKVLLTCLLSWGLLSQVFGQLTINLAVPEGTPLADTVYVAGTFNNWNPRDINWRLSRLVNGSYQITFPTTVRGSIQYKFTRGSWATVEASGTGADVPNRSMTIPPTGTISQSLTVVRWKDVLVWPSPNSSAQPNVSILSNNFLMPQLNRSRRIWLYLPPDYASTQRRYPVLYMHDGQNLFDNVTSFSGEWRVDETLNALHAQGDSGAIVVGIENGGATRMAEYNPWVNAQYGGGEGDEYLDFIVQSLKPYIDANYRTQADAGHTGLIGSSMGGLISFYGGMRNPEVFGRIGALSSALWVAPQLYTYVSGTNQSLRAGQRIHMLIGGREGNAPAGYANPYVQDQQRMARTLSSAGFSIDSLGQVDTATVLDGQHAEWFWAREFGQIYRWLFRTSSVTGVNGQIEDLELSAYPNPLSAGKQLLVLVNQTVAYCLSDMQSRVVASGQLYAGKNEIEFAGIMPGAYLLRVGRNSQLVVVK